MGLNDNIVGLWHFNGNWQDYSGNGNHGTPSGAILDTTVPLLGSGDAFFDGVDDFVTLAGVTGLNFPASDFTHAFWVRPTGIQDYMFFMGAPGLQIGYNHTYWPGKLYMYDPTMGAVVATAVTLFTLNAWHRVIYQREGTTFRFYVNAVKVGIDVAGNNGWTNQTSFYLSHPQYRHKGYMDEVVVWNRALSIAEIQQDYNGGVGVEYPVGGAVSGRLIDGGLINGGRLINGGLIR